MGVASDSPNWIRLAAEISERRAHLDKTQAEAATDGGVSLAVWSLLENGRSTSARPRTLAAVDRALGWAQGSARTILDGGEARLSDASSHQPDPDDDPAGALSADELARRRAEVEAELEADERLAWLAAHRGEVSPGLLTAMDSLIEEGQVITLPLPSTYSTHLSFLYSSAFHVSTWEKKLRKSWVN